MNLVFFGTPSFALPPLAALMASTHRVVAVVTQPDRPAGRAQKILASPVKRTAQAAGLPVLEPVGLSDPPFLEHLKSLKAQIGVVVAYGKIFPGEALSIFPKGVINLHASLLPKYRGAAPVARAILQGETETGVTVFRLDEELDHGPVLLAQRAAIDPEDTTGTLTERLCQLGSRLLVASLTEIEQGKANPKPQNDAQVTLAPRVRKVEGIVDWRLPADQILLRIRAFQPWPGATTHWEGKVLKLLSAWADLTRQEAKASPGTVVTSGPRSGLWVQTGEGQLRIDRLQLEGGKVLETADFLHGHPISANTQLK